MSVATKKIRSMFNPNRQIGSILVERGCIEPDQIEIILAFARKHGVRFGDAAVELKFITPIDIEAALSRQFNFPVLRCGDGGVSTHVVAAFDPQNSVVQGLRALRSRLILGTDSASCSKVLAITSPDRGDGRSWLAANLATVFAQTGNRTLLIDADMQHPRQHEFFRMRNVFGLSSLLGGRANKDTLHRVNPQMRLFVMAAGSIPPNSQELLTLPIFAFALRRLAERFDHIIIDTPAAMKSSDAEIVAARAGATILAGRRDHTRHDHLTKTMQRFREVGANVIGSVVNVF